MPTFHTPQTSGVIRFSQTIDLDPSEQFDMPLPRRHDYGFNNSRATVTGIRVEKAYTPGKGQKSLVPVLPEGTPTTPQAQMFYIYIFYTLTEEGYPPRAGLEIEMGQCGQRARDQVMALLISHPLPETSIILFQ